MSTDTDRARDERIAQLERRLAEYDRMIAALMTAAAGHPMGRVFLKMLAKGGHNAG